MLAVRVEGDDRLDIGGQRAPEAGPQGRALPLVRRLAEDLRTRRPGDGGGVVRGAVVDDQDREMASRAPDDGLDAGGLVVGGDEGKDLQSRWILAWGRAITEAVTSRSVACVDRPGAPSPEEGAASAP